MALPRSSVPVILPTLCQGFRGLQANTFQRGPHEARTKTRLSGTSQLMDILRPDRTGLECHTGQLTIDATRNRRPGSLHHLVDCAICSALRFMLYTHSVRVSRCYQLSSGPREDPRTVRLESQPLFEPRFPVIVPCLFNIDAFTLTIKRFPIVSCATTTNPSLARM